MSQPNQFMFPRLEMRILNSQVEPKTGNIQGKICSDDRTWKKGDTRVVTIQWMDTIAPM